VPLWHLAAYGILIGVGQFGTIYLAMNGYISPGLTSLVVQTQVFFTIGLAMYFSGERIKLFQVFALILAAAGLYVIFTHTDGTTTPTGLAMILFAALSWAVANIINRHSAKIDASLNMLGYVVWSSIFAVPILLALSLITEGQAAIEAGLAHMTLSTWIGVVWQTAANTMFGYAAWGWLLARYPAATITPMALLVPVFGMGASAIYLNEPLPAWKIAAAGLILAGLALNILWPMLRAKIVT
jgi:O-acetylserine/cysteine efflux transporter